MPYRKWISRSKWFRSKPKACCGDQLKSALHQSSYGTFEYNQRAATQCTEIKKQMARKSRLFIGYFFACHVSHIKPITVSELCSACSIGQRGLIQLTKKTATTKSSDSLLMGLSVTFIPIYAYVRRRWTLPPSQWSSAPDHAILKQHRYFQYPRAQSPAQTRCRN